jgi:PRC-barrel domain protein
VRDVERDMWTYPETLGRLDVTGFVVEAQDGSIGKVDEVTFEAGESYIVVDTGPWIFGKKVLLPAGLIERVDRDDDTVYVDRTKDEIKQAPEFDDGAYREERYRSTVGEYYGGRVADADDEEREREDEERVADRT